MINKFDLKVILYTILEKKEQTKNAMNKII